MVTALYLVSLTIFSAFLILTIVENIRTAFNKKKLHLKADPRPAVMAIERQ